jgi:hypothetical protein
MAHATFMTHATYHILNGDALASSFPASGIKGELIVMREALIAGDLQGDTLDSFWQTRAQYLEPINPTVYYNVFVKECRKILSVTADDELNCWFGYDLFCQVNMWFILSIIYTGQLSKKVFVVYPSFLSRENIWNDFGRATSSNLLEAFKNRRLFSEQDIYLGHQLWLAYKNNQLELLQTLAQKQSVCFPYLAEVCKAHADRFPAAGNKGRPELVIEDIIKNVSPDFHTVFVEFFKREGVYGFGDSQLKPLYDKVSGL